jgi:protein-S-isoprenylcysteine O-methyltransferase Ste14
LRLAAFCVYLAAWVVFAIGAVVGAIPRFQRRGSSQIRLTASNIAGAVLQIASAPIITFTLGDGPLRPRPLELIGTLALSPVAIFLFIWALLSCPRDTTSETLVTDGVYAWIRHPIYLAFLLMLIATGLLASAGQKLVLAIVVYLAGSELRISGEEKELAETLGVRYEEYRFRTRWRYFPGLR